MATRRTKRVTGAAVVDSDCSGSVVDVSRVPVADD